MAREGVTQWGIFISIVVGILVLGTAVFSAGTRIQRIDDLCKFNSGRITALEVLIEKRLTRIDEKLERIREKLK